MAEYMHLVGAEEVSRAAGNMQSAASDMRNAASSMAHSLEMHQRFMDEWLQRLEDILSKPETNIVVVRGKRG